MKKLVFFFALVATISMNAQFSLGVNGGFSVGDDDLYSFTYGVDAMYTFDSESETKFGVATGYMSYVGQEFGLFKIEDVSFLPIAGMVRFGISDKMTAGGDLGYAIGLSPDGNDGGFYFKPSLGYSLGEKSVLNMFYSSVRLGNLNSISNLGLGISFNF